MSSFNMPVPKMNITKALKNKSLHVLTPMYGGICSLNYVQSLIQLLLKAQFYGIHFSFSFVHNESLVPRARNRLVDIFMKESVCTHSVFIDADIGFDPDDIFAMMEFDYDICGAGCVKKSLRFDRVFSAMQRNPGRTFSQDEVTKLLGDFVINWEPFAGLKEFKLSEPIKVKNLGTGLLMIKREVYDRYREKYADRWYESPEDPAALPGPIHDYFRCGITKETRKYDSEDYCFCNDCIDIGFDVWLIPWMKTTHMGTYQFVGDLPAVAAMAGQM